MNVYKRLEEVTEAVNRLRPAYTKIGLRTEKDLEYFAKDLATVIVFLDTTLPLFFDEIRMLGDEVKK